ncbi:HalOD1 output domain-containing protein [Halorubrum sodomense]|uniref:Halobacterial output domain-containing protein n=1 Tax=Halorubrum sodomense TaxID=35743 RepID=A0A1I6H550_HALSD|nr:HalOD1 output domain-containing protein [Halorubrum sodomense]SFR49457.1 hypothetical protein SAMN04487937_2448 [Halorubrum sodomense]
MKEANQNISNHVAKETPEVRATYDWDSTPPSTGVVEVVSSATGREPLALPQLYGAIDSDALDTLFRSSTVETSLTFAFADCEVTVTGDGEVVAKLDSDLDSGR